MLNILDAIAVIQNVHIVHFLEAIEYSPDIVQHHNSKTNKFLNVDLP
jgi:hypothetical protein